MEGRNGGEASGGSMGEAREGGGNGGRHVLGGTACSQQEALGRRVLGGVLGQALGGLWTSEPPALTLTPPYCTQHAVPTGALRQTLAGQEDKKMQRGRRAGTPPLGFLRPRSSTGQKRACQQASAAQSSALQRKTAGRGAAGRTRLPVGLV